MNQENADTFMIISSNKQFTEIGKKTVAYRQDKVYNTRYQ